MFVIVPYGKMSLNDLLSRLNKNPMRNIFDRMDKDPMKNVDAIDINIPRFKINSDLTMINILKKVSLKTCR